MGIQRDNVPKKVYITAFMRNPLFNFSYLVNVLVNILYLVNFFEKSAALLYCFLGGLKR